MTQQDVAGTLGSSSGDAGMSADLDRVGMYVALAENQRGEMRLSDTVPNITSGGGKPGQGYPATFCIQPADSDGGQGAVRLVETDIAPTISSTDGEKQTDRGLRIATAGAVRRITPLECERLQGWPDDHTRYIENGEQADTVRYKQIGNGVSAPVAAWIAHRINIAESHSP